MFAYALKNAVEHEGKCQTGSVVSSLFHEGLEREQVKEIMPRINECVKKVNSMLLNAQTRELEKLNNLISKRDARAEGELPKIPNVVEGKIVTRLPPEPSKYNHIGHAISFLFNYVYAKNFMGNVY